MRKIFTFLTVMLCLSVTHNSYSQIFVNQNAIGDNDGSSWENAYVELHDALEAYEPGDEIWVADGTYLPQIPSAWPDSLPARPVFYIGKEVALYGGFNGTESSLSERNPDANPTILSGDLNGDDIPDDFETNRTDNANNVVYVQNVSDQSIIDGVSITNGHSDAPLEPVFSNARGGGLISESPIRLRNCRFAQNYAGRSGGGLYYYYYGETEVQLESCITERNFTENGGGGATFFNTRNFSLDSCTFRINEAGSIGGGLASTGNSAVLISNCTFEENVAAESGGGIFGFGGGDLSLVGSTFQNNNCEIHGAGAFVEDMNLSVSSCDFQDNTGVTGGGGGLTWFTVDSLAIALTVTDCSFTGGKSRLGAGIGIGFFNDDSHVEITDCYFEGNATVTPPGGGNALGGAVFVQNVNGSQDNSFDIRESVFISNITPLDGGAIDAERAKGTIANCSFSNNYAEEDGGAVRFFDTEGRIVGCEFEDNSTAGRGGGLYLLTVDSTNIEIEVDSCTFQENTAFRGGGMLAFPQTDRTRVFTRNCIFQNNSTIEGEGNLLSSGGGYYILSIGGNNNYFETADCQFTDNSTIGVGGGMQETVRGQGYSSLVKNCSFEGNQADVFGGGFRAVHYDSGNTMQFEDCSFENNNGDVDCGGLEIVLVEDADIDVRAERCFFIGNTSLKQGAGLNFYTGGNGRGDLVVEDCLFENNANDDAGASEESGGGFALNNFGQGTNNLTFSRSVFRSNSSQTGAGAIQLNCTNFLQADSVLIENCLLAGNTGEFSAGGIGMASVVDVLLRNNTLADNQSGILVGVGAQLRMQNNILYNPDFPDALGSTAANVQSLGGNFISDNSLDGALSPLDQSEGDPLFNAGTYELSENSPAVDRGVPDDLSEVDLLGTDRVLGGCVDAGAYESPYDLGLGCLTNSREIILAAGALEVFPNPAKEVAQVRISTSWRGKIELRVLNVQGQEVHYLPLQKMEEVLQMPVQLTDLSAGTYLIQVTNGKELATTSLFIQ